VLSGLDAATYCITVKATSFLGEESEEAVHTLTKQARQDAFGSVVEWLDRLACG